MREFNGYPMPSFAVVSSHIRSLGLTVVVSCIRNLQIVDYDNLHITTNLQKHAFLLMKRGMGEALCGDFCFGDSND